MESPITMVPETPEKKLYDAATRGDLATFLILVQQDPFLVDQVSYSRSRNLLHIATMAGQLGIVKELLESNLELARDVDSKMSSSLHIAAAQGYVEIAKNLLSKAPEMLWWLDNQGMNPVHIAAMRGHVEILEVLLRHDLSPGKARLHRGQTVLMLCMKHHQFAAFKCLVDAIPTLVSLKDDDGETVLTLAVEYDRHKIVEYLMRNNRLEILKDQILFKEITGMTMVIVGLIAALAFQAAVSPPGGVWQEDTSSYRAGEAVMASTHPKLYKHFSHANITAFASSLLVILLVAIQAPNSSFVFLGVIWCATWVSITSIGVSYGASIIMTNPTKTISVDRIARMVVSLSVCILVIVVLYTYIKAWLSTWKSQRTHEEAKSIAFFKAWLSIIRIWQRHHTNMATAIPSKAARTEPAWG